MDNENIIRFLSSDIKRNSASSKREPIEIDLSNDDLACFRLVDHRRRWTLSVEPFFRNIIPVGY
ncbi:hypothetical protein FKQ60_17545 [Vibrio sp. A11]|nr:hypothetical protein [Vibrio sp. A11]